MDLNEFAAQLETNPVLSYYYFGAFAVADEKGKVEDNYVKEIEEYIYKIWEPSFDSLDEYTRYVDSCNELISEYFTSSINTPENSKLLYNKSMEFLVNSKILSKEHIVSLNKFVAKLSRDSSMKVIEDLGISLEDDPPENIDLSSEKNYESSKEAQARQVEFERHQKEVQAGWKDFQKQQEDAGQSQEMLSVLSNVLTIALNMLASNNLKFDGPSFSKNGISLFAKVPHRKKLFFYIQSVPGSKKTELRKLYRMEEGEKFSAGEHDVPDTIKVSERNGYFVLTLKKQKQVDDFWEGIEFLIWRNYVRIVNNETI